jgi:hypothetical protein
MQPMHEQDPVIFSADAIKDHIDKLGSGGQGRTRAFDSIVGSLDIMDIGYHAAHAFRDMNEEWRFEGTAREVLLEDHLRKALCREKRVHFLPRQVIRKAHRSLLHDLITVGTAYLADGTKIRQ